MNLAKKILFFRKKFYGNIEIKIILDILLRTCITKGYKNKLFLMLGPTETGKSFSIKKLSFLIGKHIPLICSNGSIINSLGTLAIPFLNQLIRKSVGIKFYQENLIIRGKLSNLKIKNKKNNLSNKHAKLNLKINCCEKIYDISQGLLHKIIEKNINIGDIIIINRTTGDIYTDRSNESFCVDKEKHPDTSGGENYFDRVIITEQLITLEELDNINLKDNFLGKYFSSQLTDFNLKKNENLDEILIKWIKNKKMKIIRGFLIIDDINLLDDNKFSFIKQLILRFVCPTILCIGNSNSEDFSIKSMKKFIPLDFLRSTVLGLYRPSDCKEFFEIIKYSSFEFNICINTKVISLLIKIALDCGLKYALYLLSVSTVFKKGNRLKLKDIRSSYNLFFNCKSCLLFTGYQHFKIFNLK